MKSFLIDGCVEELIPIELIILIRVSHYENLLDFIFSCGFGQNDPLHSLQLRCVKNVNAACTTVVLVLILLLELGKYYAYTDAYYAYIIQTCLYIYVLLVLASILQ